MYRQYILHIAVLTSFLRSLSFIAYTLITGHSFYIWILAKFRNSGSGMNSQQVGGNVCSSTTEYDDLNCRIMLLAGDSRLI